MEINEKLDLILSTMNEGFDKVDKRFEQIETRLDKHDERFEQIDKRFEQIDKRFEQVNEKFEQVNVQIKRLDSCIDEMADNLKSVQSDVTEINLRLENEIQKNIQIIAEGHLDLSRNLQKAMMPSNEVEMLRVKVNLLESKVDKIEKKIAM